MFFSFRLSIPHPHGRLSESSKDKAVVSLFLWFLSLTLVRSFYPVFHVQHLIQLFPKGLILSSPFFFFLSESGLFFFPAGDVDLLHAMLFLQDALGGIVQIRYMKNPADFDTNQRNL